MGGSSVSYRPAGRSMRVAAQSRRWSSSSVSASTSTSTKSRRVLRRVRRSSQVGRLAVELDAPVGLVEAAAQSRGGAEEGRRQVMLREAVQQPVGLAPPVERRAERRRELLEHGNAGCGRLGVPVVGVLVVVDERRRVVRRRFVPAGLLGRADEVGDLVRPGDRARDHAGACAVGVLERRHHRHRARAHLAVRRQAVGRPAQIRLGVLLRDDDAAVGGGRVERAVDELPRIAHRPPSVRVFRMFTPRNSAAGQPCETAATWPGWPLPQVNTPPRT